MTEGKTDYTVEENVRGNLLWRRLNEEHERECRALEMAEEREVD